MTNHSDFVKTGLWAGSATELAIRLWERDESKIPLPWTTPLTTTLVWQTTHGTARPPTPPRAYPPPDRNAGRGHGGRDNDRRHDRRPWTRRADGTPLTTPLVWQTTHGTARPPTPPRAYPRPDRDNRRDNDRINDNKYILVTMGIFSQWSNVIQM